jgi:uncharacterized protein
MEYNVRLNVFNAAVGFAVVLGISLVTSTIVVSRSVQNRTTELTKAGRTIDMRGSAKSRVRADLGVWTIGLREQGPSLQAAYDSVHAATQTTEAYLRDRGFSETEFSVGPIRTMPIKARNQSGVELNEVTGYALERWITVTSGDVNRVAQAANTVTQLLREGIQISSNAPEFTYTKLADLRVQILGEAAQDARVRAEAIVRQTGGRIGTVRDVRANPIQVTEPNSTDVSGGGRYDTSTIDKDVTAIVNVTFGIE